MRHKIKCMMYIAAVLWAVVFVQTAITKFYVSRQDVTQAFARNQLAVEESSCRMSELCEKGGVVRGTIPGKLSGKQKQRIADSIFGHEGGSRKQAVDTGSYYVAYGYTNGISLVRQVAGRQINMNIAITYDEREDKSVVYFGVPVIREDF